MLTVLGKSDAAAGFSLGHSLGAEEVPRPEVVVGQVLRYLAGGGRTWENVPRVDLGGVVELSGIQRWLCCSETMMSVCVCVTRSSNRTTLTRKALRCERGRRREREAHAPLFWKSFGAPADEHPLKKGANN